GGGAREPLVERGHAWRLARRRHPGQLSSGTRLDHQVERGLGGAPDAGEAGLAEHRLEPRLAGLRAEGEPDLLRQRGRRAHQGRDRVEDATHRVEVVLDVVVGERLDQEPGPVLVEGSAYVARRAHRVAHVVEAIEEGDAVVAGAREALSRTRLPTPANR